MIWIKPSGIEVETNDMPETIAYCNSIGWKEKKEEVKKQKKAVK